MLDFHGLTHRELNVLRTLRANLLGTVAQAPPLTFAEYTAAVLSLRTRGLAGAEVRSVQDDYEAGTAYLIDRLWLTPEGRQVVETLPE